jgi:hypothetical protein
MSVAKHGAKLQIEGKLSNTYMNTPNTLDIIFTVAFVVVPLVLGTTYLVKKKRKGSETQYEFTPEERSALEFRRRLLMDGKPSYDAEEWRTFSVQGLVDVFCLVADVAVKIHGETKDSLLLDTAEKCHALADWMLKNANQPAYKDFDMTHTISKVRGVSATLGYMVMRR